MDERVKVRSRWALGLCAGALLCAACSSAGDAVGADAAPVGERATAQTPAAPAPPRAEASSPPVEAPAPPVEASPVAQRAVDPRASAERLERELMGRVARVKAYTLTRDFEEVHGEDGPPDDCAGGRQGLVRVSGAPCYPKDTRVRVLEAAEVERLMAFFWAPKHYHKEEMGWTAACFTPHHAWGFFDAKGELLAHLSLCLGCNYYVASPLLYPLEEAACGGREGCVRESPPASEGEGAALDLTTGSIALSLEGARAFREVCVALKLGQCDVRSYIEEMSAGEGAE